MKQFFYERREPRAPKEGETDIQWTSFIDSFDMNRVIRTLDKGDNQIVLLLDDGHEETREVPVQNSTGKVTGYQKSREYLQSQIHLNQRDTERFRLAAGYDAGDFMSSTPVSREPESMGDTQPEIPFPIEAE